jgi:hypothetical protein
MDDMRGSRRSSPSKLVVEGQHEHVAAFRFKWLGRDDRDSDDHNVAPGAVVTSAGVHHPQTWSDLKRWWARSEAVACPACPGAVVPFASADLDDGAAAELRGVCVHCGVRVRWRGPDR